MLICALAALALGAFALPAHAAGLSPAAADCNKHDGRLTGNYTAAELRQAIATLPADISEYSNCAAVLQQALDAKIGNLHGKGGSGGGSFLPTWLLIVLIVLVLGGVGFVTAAIRRRGDGNGPAGPGNEPPGPPRNPPPPGGG